MTSMVVASGNVGIRNTNPTFLLDINGDFNIKGNLLLNDPTSAIGPMACATTPTIGNPLTYGSNYFLSTLTLQHNTSGGTSSILFKSTSNRNSDFGYIQYYDNVSYSVNSTLETCLFVIGSENDGSVSTVGSDRIAFMPGVYSSGYVGINTIYPSYALHVIGTAYKSAGGSSWNTTSDMRIKENIIDADLDLCYHNCKNLKLKYFKWKDFMCFENDQHVLGFIADEVLDIFPKSVKKITKEVFHKKNEKGEMETIEIPDFLTLNTDSIHKSMFGTIQKLIIITEKKQHRIESNKNKIELLKNKFQFLKKTFESKF